MKRILAFTLALLLITSCTKEQQAKNNIKGEWEYVSITKFMGGEETSELVIEGSKMTFEKCSSRNEEWCSGTIQIGGFEVPFDYQFIDGGKRMLYKETSSVFPEIQRFYMSELTRSKMRFEKIENGAVIKYELSKK